MSHREPHSGWTDWHGHDDEADGPPARRDPTEWHRLADDSIVIYDPDRLEAHIHATSAVDLTNWR